MRAPQETAERNFYPRPPRGGRRTAGRWAIGSRIFLSTPSARRATLVVCPRRQGGLFLSTPSARRATSRVCDIIELLHNFYPRPPRGGRRRALGGLYAKYAFLSTPSARRATAFEGLTGRHSSISIHALREEGDSKIGETGKLLLIFLSTPSARRATEFAAEFKAACKISIHALREEGDSTASLYCSGMENFYPRPPRGGRLKGDSSKMAGIIFLSTPSARRATQQNAPTLFDLLDFYPRPPRGGRPGCL